MKKYIIIPTTLVLGSIFVSCLTTKNSTTRNPNNITGSECPSEKYEFKFKGQDVYPKAKTAMGNDGKCNIQVPGGLQGNDLADFEHISEGADVFPYEWYMALKSKTDDGATYFHEKLEQKFGILPSANLKTEKNGKTKEFLVPYVGFTSAWSDHAGKNSDAFKDESEIVRQVGEVKSIKMVGTNCSLCHSGGIKYNGASIKIDGTPAMVNVRAFFKDMIISTFITMKDEGKLTDFFNQLYKNNPAFYDDLKVKGVKSLSSNNQALAADFSNRFGHDFGKATSLLTKLGLPSVDSLSTFITLVFAKVGSKTDSGLLNFRMHRGNKAIHKYLTELLRTTYGLQPADKIGALDSRMEYLSGMAVGLNPSLDETKSGYNRTDAFGRIGNLVLRGEDPQNITAPVSLPWIWGLKYMANLHYNGNSNSVILRNVGQSLGLGALVLNDKMDSTVNVYNLDRLEKLVHKVEVPDWRKVFKSYPELALDMTRVEKGYEHYHQKCIYCHESNHIVGPNNVLRENLMFPLAPVFYKSYNPKKGTEAISTQDWNEKIYPYSRARGFDIDKYYADTARINTDPYAALNPIKPIGGKPFEMVILGAVAKIKARYYAVNNITPKEQELLEYRDIRGNEFFRDTYNGFEKQGEFSVNYGNIPKGMGYKARHLSGVWSTGPFMHNGSVPNLFYLFSKVSERPKTFNVRDSEFDPKLVGLKNFDRKNKKCHVDDEGCFDISKTGNSNVGHEYGSELTAEQKLDLIEFLKYLPPEPEYSWNKETY